MVFGSPWRIVARIQHEQIWDVHRHSSAIIMTAGRMRQVSHPYGCGIEVEVSIDCELPPESQGHLLPYPASGSTYRRQHDDLIQLRIFVANVKAECIFMFRQSHRDYRTFVNYCLTGIEERIRELSTGPSPFVL